MVFFPYGLGARGTGSSPLRKSNVFAGDMVQMSEAKRHIFKSRLSPKCQRFPSICFLATYGWADTGICHRGVEKDFFRLPTFAGGGLYLKTSQE